MPLGVCWTLPEEGVDQRCQNLARSLESQALDLVGTGDFVQAVGGGLDVLDSIETFERQVWKTALRHGVRVCQDVGAATGGHRAMMACDADEAHVWNERLSD